MTLTNNNGLPEFAAAFVRNQVFGETDYDRVADPDKIHVTTLIDSVMQRQLKIAHGAEVEGDVSDYLDIAVGKSIHAGIETALAVSDEVLNETHLERTIEIFGRKITISGTVDIIEKKDGKLTIWDIKTTSVWKLVFSDMREWKNQLAVYSWLVAGNMDRFPGYELSDEYGIFMWFKDHSKQKTKSGDNYPRYPFAVRRFKRENVDDVDNYVRQRVIEFLRNETNPIDEVPECTSEERWAKPDEWAVYALKKDGERKSRADRLFDNEDDAKRHAEKIQGVIELRPGRNTRCLDYCSYREFCPFGKKLEAKE